MGSLLRYSRKYWGAMATDAQLSNGVSGDLSVLQLEQVIVRVCACARITLIHRCLRQSQ